MKAGRKVCGTFSGLLAFLVFSSLICLTEESLQVLSAPNVLRVGAAENIFVEWQGCEDFNTGVSVEIIVWSHPTKHMVLATTTVTLTSSNHFQAFGQITIPPADFGRDPSMKQYVTLQAKFPGRLLEKVVLVSFQSGYIFIQTDKTLYTPDSVVLFRIFALTPRMEPRQMDDLGMQNIAIEIVSPEGIVYDYGSISLRSGLHSGSYKLAETVSPGQWKVVAKWESNRQQKFASGFEVKEHQLPSFEVKLTSGVPFFYVDTEELTININARYLFGEAVDGQAFAVFGVVHEDQKKSFQSSLQRVMIVNGVGEVTLRREHITETFKNVHELVAKNIYVSVRVLTDRGGEMVEAELRNIQIVTSPYTISLKKTPKYFKPGLPFDVSIELENPDGTPAQGVPVVLEPDLLGMTDYNGIARLSINTWSHSGPLTITARSSDPHIPSQRQASATMVALPYKTKRDNYIQIGVDASVVQLGDIIKINLILNRQDHAQKDITYLILSRGQLVKHGRYQTSGQIIIALILPVTKEMLPSFRIIAYYHTNHNEVVADSVWVDVKDSCMGSLKLEPGRPTWSTISAPRRMFGLKVTGDPGATVALVAVDKGTYVLNNKNIFTQKKVWDTVEKDDIGCTSGGGEDSMGVFYDAGLLFESSASGTPYRLDSKCATHSRTKRDRPQQDLMSTDDEDTSEFIDMGEIMSRTKFPDSWMWIDFTMPACPPGISHCETTSLAKQLPLPDSITTWMVIGVSLSETQGICVADPLEVVVRKAFFIDLNLPYSAVRGEQLEVKAIIHNYSPEPVTVRVDLMEDEHVCSAASKRGKYRQLVRVEAETTRSVPFIIIPTKEGRHPVEVKAAVGEEYFLSDGIRKMLHVVPEGVLIKSYKVLTVNPASNGVDGLYQATLNSRIPRKYVAPDTPMITLLSLTGRPDKSLQVENRISGHSMGSLIQPASLDPDENINRMALNVIATVYLDKTNQWETVGFDKRSRALNYIRTGYQHHLFHMRRISTRLTAYAARVSVMAYSLIAMEHSSICSTMQFLLLLLRRGMLGDDGFGHHRYVFMTDSHAFTTAHRLLAIQESHRICGSTVDLSSGMTFLQEQLPSLTDPNDVALISYVLAKENRLDKRILFNFASQDSTHWPSSRGHDHTLEATAYALLALVEANAFKEARPVFEWIAQQPRSHGGYGSSRATFMVYQAALAYMASVNEQENNLKVDLFLSGRSRPSQFLFNKDNYYTTRTTKMNAINEDVSVTATGTGEATLTMVSMYYTLPQDRDDDCQKFDLSVQLIPEGGDETIYRLRIEILYKDKQNDATMSIVDIGLLKGFAVNADDLLMMSKTRSVATGRYEMEPLMEGDSLILHLNSVSHRQPELITFRIHERIRVGALQPAAVSVYQYNDTTSCNKFYHPERKTGQLPRHCKNGHCTCLAVEDNCSMQIKENLDDDMRTVKSGFDFVYRIRVEELPDDVFSGSFPARIEKVIAAGSIDVDPLGKLRSFLSFPRCRESLGITNRNTYLIMGKSKDIQSHGTHSFQYELGEKTWFEYWPDSYECFAEQHRPTCLGIKKLVRQYEVFKCRQ